MYKCVLLSGHVTPSACACPCTPQNAVNLEKNRTHTESTIKVNEIQRAVEKQQNIAETRVHSEFNAAQLVPRWHDVHVCTGRQCISQVATGRVIMQLHLTAKNGYSVLCA